MPAWNKNIALIHKKIGKYFVCLHSKGIEVCILQHIATTNTCRDLLFSFQGDNVARALMDYADSESFNPSTKQALKKFAEDFAGVQDYREVEVYIVSRSNVFAWNVINFFSAASTF